MTVGALPGPIARWSRRDGPVLAGPDGYLRVDDLDSLGLLEAGVYEPYETSLLVSLALPGTVVVDVGANIGYHTIQFARAVGPRGRVYAIEPDPDNLRILRHNLRTNGLNNVVVVPKAASDTTGSLRLFRSPDNRGDHRVYDSGDGREAISIESTALDDVLTDVAAPVSVMKLDIQGGELSALAGMTRFLSRHPEAWIATELWPIGLHRAGASVDEYLARLGDLGAPLLRVDEQHRRLTPLERAWLDEHVTVARGNHTNLLIPRRDWLTRT